jgi:hypothetical protein
MEGARRGALVVAWYTDVGIAWRHPRVRLTDPVAATAGEVPHRADSRSSRLARLATAAASRRLCTPSLANTFFM